MIRPSVLCLLLAGAALTACGGEERGGTEVAAAATPEREAGRGEPPPAATATPVPARPAKRRRGRTVKRVDSPFGKILADARGQAFYAFDEEDSPKPECYGACARAWPPVLTKGRPVGGRGVATRRLGTTRRRSGRRQVTVDGRPLYYYVDDAPGRVLCHNVDEFGGLWLVVRPDGTPVR